LGTKLYVGNLSYNISKVDLEQMFAAHGTVVSAQVIIDRETQRSKGFGFVEMGSDQQAQSAISALNGKSVDGRALTVNEARPQEPRTGGIGGAGLAGARRGPGGGTRGPYGTGRGGSGGAGGGNRY
jgi:RNA recognition motif-containing protein